MSQIVPGAGVGCDTGKTRYFKKDIVTEDKAKERWRYRGKKKKDDGI